MLAMASNAARTKAKACEARHNQVRQEGYRAVRYRRSQGRRGQIQEEEIRVAVRARCARSIHMMTNWLESQAQANAEEGTPREGPVCGMSESVGQKLLTSFLL